MRNILITGATGNIGQEVIRHLFANHTQNRIIAGVRDIGKAQSHCAGFAQLEYVKFDFEAPETFLPALSGIDCVFLLRPPHIANVGKYFAPLISDCVQARIQQVMFLSVQGVETSRMIPHHKIETLIVASGLDHIFIRPSYFMQNLTTTLLDDIRRHREIVLPAGDAKFNWVDIKNIAEACALLLDTFEADRNRAFEITGDENETFESVTSMLNEAVIRKIRYVDATPLGYYLKKRREGVKRGLILVMIMLHYLPRFRKEPKISNSYTKLTGKKPTTLRQFILREKTAFDC